MDGRDRVSRGHVRYVATLVAAAAILLPASSLRAQAPHRCSAAALEQAGKLLTFHFGPDKRIEIAKSAKQLPALRNPANRRQLFDVLEVWGTIYKSQYRMRFIYARIPGDCVLMGQEILEYASL